MWTCLTFFVFLPALLIFLVWKFVLNVKPVLIDPRGKSIFVTGAASGIGKITTQMLLKAGCFVYAADLNAQQLEDLYSKETNVRTIKLDVTNPEQIEAAVKIVREQGKGLDGIVNSAGIAVAPAVLRQEKVTLQGSLESPFEHTKAVLDVNLLGTIRICQAFFPLLLDYKGCIVNIASVAGMVGLPFGASYSTSKFGVIGFSESIRRECSLVGVRVACIKPGFTATPLLTAIDSEKIVIDKTKTVFGDYLEKRLPDIRKGTARAQSPDRVGEAIVSALFSNPTPEHLVVDYWFMRPIWCALAYLPSRLTDRIVLRPV